MSGFNRIDRKDRVPFQDYKGAYGSIYDIYERYPKGYYGWFAFVQSLKTFAYWDIEEREWKGLDPSNMYTRFMTRYEVVDTLFNLKPKGNVAVEALIDQQFTLQGLECMKPGYEMRIIIKNVSQNPITISLPTESPIFNDYGGSIILQPDEITEFSLWCYFKDKYRLSNVERKSRDYTDAVGENVLQDANSYTDTKLNQSVLSDISIDNNPTTKRLQLNETSKNLLSGITSNTSNVIPNASEVQDGAMPKESFQQIGINTADIAIIKGTGRAAANLGNTPTQQQLTDAWTAIKGAAPLDNATVVNLDQDAPAGHAWTYLETSPGVFEWIDRGTDTVNQAATDVLGLVKGVAAIAGNAGKVFVENDGSMSVVGWDALAASLADALPYIAFKLASQSLTSVANIPATASYTLCQISASATMSIANISSLKSCYEMVIEVENTGASAITLTLPTVTGLRNNYGQPTVSIPAGKVAEVNILCGITGNYSMRVGDPN
ncbi:hypothetical protein [Dysgonomonas termitidis]|uniref:Uncharacterized protein n=1 Tax=Dysgonomonas termitidis TaxID=1516126 RepID=A0ABV9L325_9BACT